MPKLTLRDLFAVVTIVALALGWWLDRSRLAEKNKLGIMHGEELRHAIMAEEKLRVAEQRLAVFRDQPSPSN